MGHPLESEKITINLGVIDLGQIDLLVGEGFYSNRTDFIRTAIRNQVAAHADVVKQTVSRRTLTLGLQHFTRADLEAARLRGAERSWTWTHRHCRRNKAARGGKCTAPC